MKNLSFSNESIFIITYNTLDIFEKIQVLLSIAIFIAKKAIA